MSKIMVISGTIEKIIGNRPHQSSGTELQLIEDCSDKPIAVKGTSREVLRPSCRINIVGQWRVIKRTGDKLKYFHAAAFFSVPHLLDTNEEWVCLNNLSHSQKLQLIDGSCILQNLGVSQERAREISLLHRDRLLPTLMTAPFKILEEEGDVDFEAADKYAKTLGLPPTTKDRAAAGLRAIFKSALDHGKTEISVIKLKDIAIKKYFVFWTIAEEILGSMEKTGAIKIRTDGQHKNITIVDPDRSKKISAPSQTSVGTGNTVTDLFLLRDKEDTFIWEETVRMLSEALNTHLKTTRHMTLIIDAAEGSLPPVLSGKIYELADLLGAKILHCSALTPAGQKVSALDRYLVGLEDSNPELIIIEDAHLLDFRKMKLLVQQLKNSEGVIFLGNGAFRHPQGGQTPLNLLMDSKVIPTLKAKENQYGQETLDGQ